MTLSQFAAIADLLTALGVIVSLLFVLFELRRTNAETKLTNWFSLAQTLMAARGLTDDPVLGDVVLRGRERFDTLTPLEVMQYQKYLLRMQLAAQASARLNGRGMEPGSSDRAVAIRHIRDEWDFPGPRAWWASIRHDPPVAPGAKRLIDEALGMEDPI